MDTGWHGWHKLNIDSSMKNNLIAAGGVIRSDRGELFLGFTKFIEIRSIELVEVWALQIGLHTAASLNIKKTTIEIDCKEIFLLITQNNKDLHPLAAMMLNCRQLLQSFEGHNLKQNSRRQNRCIDAMAKEARTNLLPLRTYPSALHFVYEAYVTDLSRCQHFLSAFYFLRLSYVFVCCKGPFLPFV